MTILKQLIFEAEKADGKKFSGPLTSMYAPAYCLFFIEVNELLF